VHADHGVTFGDEGSPEGRRAAVRVERIADTDAEQSGADHDQEQA
jgi:hypothetical protein